MVVHGSLLNASASAPSKRAATSICAVRSATTTNMKNAARVDREDRHVESEVESGDPGAHDPCAESPCEHACTRVSIRVPGGRIVIELAMTHFSEVNDDDRAQWSRIEERSFIMPSWSLFVRLEGTVVVDNDDDMAPEIGHMRALPHRARIVTSSWPSSASPTGSTRRFLPRFNRISFVTRCSCSFFRRFPPSSIASVVVAAIITTEHFTSSRDTFLPIIMSASPTTTSCTRSGS